MKIRATAQRSRIRDRYDLHQFTTLRFERGVVRRIAIIKCWETNYALDPVNFLSELSDRQYDWADLSRLVKHSKSLTPSAIFEKIRQNYRFLAEMSPEEAILAGDAYKRERKVYEKLVGSLRKG